MKSVLSFSVALLMVAMTQSDSAAGTIVPGDITVGSASFTTGDGLVTLNPFSTGGGAGTLGASGCCIGVTGGTNNNAVTDGDGDPATTADRERLDIVLDATASLTDFSLIWTRANGPEPDDGMVFSGFASDPSATLDAASVTAGVTISYDAGSLYVNQAWRAGTQTFVTLGSSAATQGQTISIGANDSDEAGARGSINTINYAVVPEPTSMMLGGLAIACLALRRK